MFVQFTIHHPGEANHGEPVLVNVALVRKVQIGRTWRADGNGPQHTRLIFVGTNDPGYDAVNVQEPLLQVQRMLWSIDLAPRLKESVRVPA